MKTIIKITLFLSILTSCSQIRTKKLLENQDEFVNGEFITLKWDTVEGKENNKIGKIRGYKIYHGEESGIYQSCLNVDSPIQIPVKYVKDQKSPSFKIPLEYISEKECYFIISSYNESGESSASGEIQYVKQQK